MRRPHRLSRFFARLGRACVLLLLLAFLFTASPGPAQRSRRRSDVDRLAEAERLRERWKRAARTRWDEGPDGGEQGARRARSARRRE